MKKIRSALITLGWGISIATLTLQAFYGGHSYSIEYLNTYGPAVTFADMALFFPLSILLGLIAPDLDLVIKIFFWAIGLSIILTYLCLTLPSYLGVVGPPILQQILSQGAIVYIFRSMVPVSIICLIGSLLGAFLGERLKLRYTDGLEG